MAIIVTKNLSRQSYTASYLDDFRKTSMLSDKLTVYYLYMK